MKKLMLITILVIILVGCSVTNTLQTLPTFHIPERDSSSIQIRELAPWMEVDNTPLPFSLKASYPDTCYP